MIQVSYATYYQTFNIFYTHGMTEVNKKGNLKGKSSQLNNLRRGTWEGNMKVLSFLPW